LNRLLIASVFLLAGSVPALADQCTVGTIDNSNYAPDDTSISITFDQFRALVDNPGFCDLRFDAHNNLANDPNLFEVYSADYRGSVSPTPDDQAQDTIDHNGRSTTVTQTDTGGSTFYSDYVGKEADGTLHTKFNTAMSVATDPNSEATIDAIDYALVGTMTRADAESSLDSVARDQLGIIAHLDATTGLITGGTLEGANEAGLFGSVGSLTIGARARYNLAKGFSLLGGLSLVDQSPGAHYAGLVAVGSVRWVQPQTGGPRLFGEAGGEAGALSLQFTRNYIYTDTNPTLVPVTTTGTGVGLLGAVYGKAGVSIEADKNNVIVLSASIKESFLGFSHYQEPQGVNNLFAADLGGKTQSFTTAKLGADWTTTLSRDLSLTSSLAVGTTFGSAPQAYIFGGGDVTGAAASTVFAEYGVNVGWQMSPTDRINGFVQGSTGIGIGTHLQVGAGYTASF